MEGTARGLMAGGGEPLSVPGLKVVCPAALPPGTDGGRRGDPSSLFHSLLIGKRRYHSPAVIGLAGRRIAKPSAMTRITAAVQNGVRP